MFIIRKEKLLHFVRLIGRIILLKEEIIHKIIVYLNV
jgi:hypothetical protein